MRAHQRILLRAAQLIEKHGWAQRTGHGPHGELCATSAIHRAKIELHSRHASERAARAALQELLPTYVQRRFGGYHAAIIYWNDHGVTRAQTVVDRLRRAAKA